MCWRSLLYIGGYCRASRRAIGTEPIGEKTESQILLPFLDFTGGLSHRSREKASLGVARKDSSLERSPAADIVDRSYAIVTPTFLPDLKRCELLAEFLDHTAPTVPHYLIVDRRDRRAFAHLQGGRRRIIESEAIIGRWIFRLPGRRGLWLSLKAPPVRGWIVQQLLKIGVSDAIPERTLIFCDSDVAFVRPFGRTNLLIDGKVGLLDVEFVNDLSQRWTTTARRLLGVTRHNDDYRSYVGNMICWKFVKP